jgi:hypothetical protein
MLFIFNSTLPIDITPSSLHTTASSMDKIVLTVRQDETHWIFLLYFYFHFSNKANDSNLGSDHWIIVPSLSCAVEQFHLDFIRISSEICSRNIIFWSTCIWFLSWCIASLTLSLFTEISGICLIILLTCRSFIPYIGFTHIYDYFVVISLYISDLFVVFFMALISNAQVFVCGINIIFADVPYFMGHIFFPSGKRIVQNKMARNVADDAYIFGC